MINVRVRNENNVDLAESLGLPTTYGVSRIVQKSHSCRILKKNCAVLCAKLASTLPDRRDFNVLAERDGRSPDQHYHDIESLRSDLHSRNLHEPISEFKRNVVCLE